MYGTVQLFPFKFVPQNWLPCTGLMLPIAQYQILYSLLGTTFGGDGTTDFALPDLRGKEPLAGLQYFICNGGVYPTQP